MPTYNTIIEAFEAHANKNPQKLAVSSDGLSLNYGQLYKAAIGFAKYLVGKGFRHGDVVVMQAPQSVQFVVAYLGTYAAGGIFAPLERNVATEDMNSVLERTQAFLLISEHESKLTRWLDWNNVLQTGNEHTDDSVSVEYPRPEEPAELLFTSGTTGRAKGVLTSHANVMAVAENMIEGAGYHEDTFIIVPNPLSHANGFRKISVCVISGGGFVIINGMADFGKYFKILDEMPVNGLCLPTAILHALLVLSGDTLGKYSGQIEFIETSTAPIPDDEKAHLCEMLPNTRLIINYGLSEAGTLTTYDYNKIRGKKNCVGFATKNSRVFIVDEDRNEIESSKDNTGTIAASGGAVMIRYWDDPELTARTIANDCLYTSDVGYIEDDMLYIVGRQDDLIHVGGLKVAPIEIEEAAMNCSGVKDCICIAVNDPHSGQAPKLFIVPSTDVPFDRTRIAQELRTILEDYKIPKIIEEIDEVPYSPIGKKLRRLMS